jgi:hypothetical protein
MSDPEYGRRSTSPVNGKRPTEGCRRIKITLIAILSAVIAALTIRRDGASADAAPHERPVETYWRTRRFPRRGEASHDE